MAKGSTGVSFDDILNKKVEDIEMPKPLPAGQYRGRIAGVPEDASFDTKDQDTGEQKHVAACRIPINLTEPMDGVDMAALEAAGGLTLKNGKAKQVRARFYLEEGDLHKLKRFGKSLGIEAGDLRTMFQQMPGQDVIVDIGLRPDPKDAENWFNDVNRVTGTVAAA